jgi:molybdopterin converting factor subunit 1
MNVRVRLFAAVRQIAGQASVEVDLPEEATIAQLRARLAREFPATAALLAQALFAIDVQYARDSDKIRPGAEVACIPPVSGG